MATITPTTTINPATMAANWGPGVQNNAQKWQNKTLNPRTLFNQNPTQNQANWAAGVQKAQAAGTYAAKLSAVNMANMANAISTYGTTNYSASGTQKAAKYAAKTQALAAALTAVRSTVESMPTGKGANNEARMLAWSRGMASYKGKI
jgi:septum formation inhibitor MinC